MRDSQTATDAETAAGGGISARDVTVSYRNGHTALRHASFEIPRGTVTELVGVNGAGKSTLFKAIMGFVPAAAGEISLLGMSVKEALKRNLVAYVPQSEEVDWSFPVLVEDVVMMGRYGHMGFLRRPRRVDHEAVAEALAKAFLENIDEIRGVHGAMKQLTPELMVSQTVLPFHPGAEKVYKDAGLIE